MMKLRERVRCLVEVVGRCSSLSLEEVVQRFAGKRRRRYENALELYRLRGLWRKDANVKEFVKQEAVLFSETKVNPSCRAIQWRDPVYTLNLISLIRNTEDRLYNCRGGKGFPDGRFIAKNMTPAQRAQTLREKWLAMPGCKVLELDASRFDAHVTEELLRVEHRFWYSCNPSKLLKQMLSWQVINKGIFFTQNHSIRYRVKGGRMSGDANTAGGNCVIMACLLSQFGLDHFTEFDFICDGDDSVFFYRGEITDDQVKSYFRDFGFTMKIEARPEFFEQISFCQARPCKIGGKWLMVRDPKKVLGKTTINLKFSDPNRRCSLLKTIALGELSIYAGCPIIDPYLRRLIESADKHSKGPLKLDREYIASDYRLSRDMPQDWTRIRDIPITPDARDTFALAYGISVAEQLETEDALRGWWCSPKPPDYLGEGVDTHRWAFDWLHLERSA